MASRPKMPRGLAVTTALRRTRAAGVSRGDRVIYEGEGQLHGRPADVTGVSGKFSRVRFSNGLGVLVPTGRLTVIPRRPDPDS